MVKAIFPKKRSANKRQRGANKNAINNNLDFNKDPFEAEVVDMASDGRGVIYHPDGRVCFVAGVWLSERGTFRLVDVKGRTGTAEVVELAQRSTHRVSAHCRYHGHTTAHCGGCPWQSIEYTQQLAAKQKRVEAALSKWTKRDVVADIWGSPTTLGYRNRAQFKSDGVRVGYVATGTNELVDIDHCPVLTDHNNELLAALRQQLPNPNWQPTKKAPWVTLNIDDSIEFDDVSVNARLPFRQANNLQNEKMKQWLRSRLTKVDTSAPVIELFSGSGNFTEVLAEQAFPEITAVEVVGEALEALTQKAWPNVTVKGVNLYEQGGLLKALKTQPRAKTLVLDPPRDGLKERDALFAKSCKIHDILYISCDLATFTRDVAELCESGFKLLEVQPLDQFPHTAHVEILAHLRKRIG